MKSKSYLKAIILVLMVLPITVAFARELPGGPRSANYVTPDAKQMLTQPIHVDSIIIYGESDTVKQLITYTATGLPENKTELLLTNGTYVNSYLTGYSYTTNGRLDQLFELRWINNTWKYLYRTMYTYNQAGKPLTAQIQAWVNDNWLNFQLDIMTYNEAGQLLTLLTRNWDNGAWMDVYFTTYTYDAAGNLYTEIRQNANGSIWENVIQNIYTYDINHHLLTNTIKYWINAAWENATLFTNTWNASGNKQEELIQQWDMNSWHNFSRSLFYYDNSGKCLYTTGQMFYNSSWVNSTQCDYTYAPGHVSGTGSNWNGSDWSPGLCSIAPGLYVNNGQQNLHTAWAGQVDVYYEGLTTGSENIGHLPDNRMSVYPNPVRGEAHIAFDQTSYGNVIISLYSLDGALIKLIHSGELTKGPQNLSFSTDDLASGLYLLELQKPTERMHLKVSVSR